TSRIVFFGLALASVLVFGWGVYRRTRLWRLGTPLLGKIPSHVIVSNLCRYVLLQRRILGRGRFSVAHILLFSAFLVLLLRTPLLAIEHALAVLLGRAGPDNVFHRGVYYAV